MWIFNQKKHLHFPWISLDLINSQRLVFSRLPWGMKTHSFRKKYWQNPHAAEDGVPGSLIKSKWVTSFGQITATLHKRFLFAPKWWWSKGLPFKWWSQFRFLEFGRFGADSFIQMIKWFVHSSPFRNSVRLKKNGADLFEKKNDSRVWCGQLCFRGLFVDLKWNLPPNNGKIATMFGGDPQDIATWTLPLLKRTFWTAGKYSSELWMGWSLSAINGYNSGRMHPWGSWSVRYPPEVKHNPWKVTFPIEKSSSNPPFLLMSTVC